MTYTALPVATRATNVQLPQRRRSAPSSLSWNASARLAMTDFTAECPLATSPERRIEQALAEMKLYGVRALLVVEDGRVLGLISAYDILGERPVQFLQSPNCTQESCNYHDVRVRDIMVPWPELRTLAFEQVRTARIGDVWETFRASDLTHLLVTDTVENHTAIVAGLFSRTHLERALALQPTPPAPLVQPATAAAHR